MTMLQDLAALLGASASGITPAIAGSVAAGAAGDQSPAPAPVTQDVAGLGGRTGPSQDELGAMVAGLQGQQPTIGGWGAPSQDQLGAMVAALQSQQATLGDPHGGWWDRMQDRVYNFGADVVGSDAVGALGDAAGWGADQAGIIGNAGRDAWGTSSRVISVKLSAIFSAATTT